MYFVFCVDHRANSDYFNWLVCITERESVYCAVRTGCLNIMHVISTPGLRPCHGSAGYSPAFHHCEDLGPIPGQSVFNLRCSKWQLDWFFSSTSVFPCQYHSADAPYSSSPTRCSYQNDKQAKPGTFRKSIGERWVEKNFHLVFKLLSLF